jgi:ribosomal protein S18 acetylase RimI-like enzyme
MQAHKLVEADAEALWKMRLRSLQEAPAAFLTTYEEALAPGWKERFLDGLQPESRTFFVGALEDGQLVGMVCCFTPPSRKGQHLGMIVSMYVAPEARGRGVGKVIMQEAIAQASLRPDIEQLNLGVLLPNPAAQQLYRSLGFASCGLVPRSAKLGEQYWDEEVMVLRL